MLTLWTRFQELLLRLRIEAMLGPSCARMSFQTLRGPRIVNFVQTIEGTVHLCESCGRKRATTRTKISGTNPHIKIDAWTCKEHAPDWRDYL